MQAVGDRDPARCDPRGVHPYRELWRRAGPPIPPELFAILAVVGLMFAGVLVGALWRSL